MGSRRTIRCRMRFRSPFVLLRIQIFAQAVDHEGRLLPDGQLHRDQHSDSRTDDRYSPLHLLFLDHLRLYLVPCPAIALEASLPELHLQPSSRMEQDKD